jgi:hypothetical protein
MSGKGVKILRGLLRATIRKIYLKGKLSYKAGQSRLLAMRPKFEENI